MDRGGGWTGFSDEDLRKLKQSSKTGESSADAKDEKIKSANIRPTGNRPKRTGQTLTTQTSSNEVLPTSQRLSSTTEPATERTIERNSSSQATVDKRSAQRRTETKVQSQKDSTAIVGSTIEPSRKSRPSGAVMRDNGAVASPGEQTSHATTSSSSREPVSSQDEEPQELILDESSILAREMMSMGKFREQQKMMEELNKKKKALLTCALQERTKKAKVEAVRLTLIRQELEKLDQMVVSDVSIIRNKIEESSREYLEAQKRYDRAEKEFIESKLDLHKKQEYKDQLTEHLYTVIHQNEQRKAKKLSQLMDRLEMEDTDNEDGGGGLNDLSPPPLCLISPVESRKSCLQSIPGFSSSPVGAPSTTGEKEANASTHRISDSTSPASVEVKRSDLSVANGVEPVKDVTAVTSETINGSTGVTAGVIQPEGGAVQVNGSIGVTTEVIEPGVGAAQFSVQVNSSTTAVTADVIHS